MIFSTPFAFEISIKEPSTDDNDVLQLWYMVAHTLLVLVEA